MTPGAAARRGLWPAVLAFVLFALPAGAQRPATPGRPAAGPDQPTPLDVARLDETIRLAHAAADTAHGEGEVAAARRMNAFARQAAALRERAGVPRPAAGRLQQDLADMVRQCRRLERDLTRGPGGSRTRAAWTQVVRSVEGLREEGTRGTTGVSTAPPQATDRVPVLPERSDEGLAAELERRVRAAQAAGDRLEPVEESRAFTERFFAQAAGFSAGVGQLDRQARKERARALLAEARRIQRSLAGPRASPELLDAWNRVIETLALMSGQ